MFELVKSVNLKVVLVHRFVHVDALDFEAVVDAALDLLQAKLGHAYIFELHEDGANFSPESLLSRADDFDRSELADILELRFEVVSELFILIHG